MRAGHIAPLLALLAPGARAQHVPPPLLGTTDGAQCGLPYVYDPDEAAIYASDKNYAPTEYRDCTYDGSAIYEPWCSTGASGAFTGSWGACTPGELFHDEAQDHSLLFSGQRGALLESEGEYELDGGLTLELWLRPAGVNQAGTMTQYALATHGSFRIGLFGASNTLVYTADGLHPPAVGGAPGSGAPLLGNIHTSAELDYGAWTHVALVYDGARLECFADGRLVDSRAAVGRIPRASGRVSLGGDPAEPDAAFHGALDEVRIWASARTQRALVGNMLQPLRPADIARSRLLAYWPIVAGDSSHHVKDVAAPSHTALPEGAWWASPPELVLRPLHGSRWGADMGGTDGLLQDILEDAKLLHKGQPAGGAGGGAGGVGSGQEHAQPPPDFPLPQQVHEPPPPEAGEALAGGSSSASGAHGAHDAGPEFTVHPDGFAGSNAGRAPGASAPSGADEAAPIDSKPAAPKPAPAAAEQQADDATVVISDGGGGRRLSDSSAPPPATAELARLIKDAPFHLEALGGSKFERLPLARALGGEEMVLSGEAGTHLIAPGSAQTLRLHARGTLELWVLPAAHNAQNAARMTLINKEGSYAFGLTAHRLTLWYSLGGRGAARKHGFGFGGKSAQREEPVAVLEACALRAGIWSHVALAFDKSGATAYVDGVECARDAGARGGDLTPSAKPLEVGGQLLQPDLSFAGALDEVRVWRNARTPAQLQALMLDTLRADFQFDARTDGLMASYGFSEGYGRVARAAHRVGKEDEESEARELVVVGSAFAWRLGTSPASLIAGATDDPEPVRFSLAFGGLAGAAAHTAPGLSPIRYGDEFAVELWFSWHGPNAARTPTQVLAHDGGAFTISLGGTAGSAGAGAGGEEEADLRVSLQQTTMAAETAVGVRIRRGVWYHVSLSRDLRGKRANGGAASLLVNGSPVPLGPVQALAGGSRAAGGTLPASAVLLGNDAGGGAPLHGAVSEVRVWNEARDAGETSAFHLSRLLLDSDDDERTLPARPFGNKLHAYWPLDEGHGEASVDRSGQARRLQLDGPASGVWWARSTSPIARSFDGRYASGFALGFGSCAGLRGSSHVAVPGSDSIHLRGGMTAEAWINLGSETPPVVAPLPGEKPPAEPAPALRTRRRVVMSRAGVFELGVSKTGELFVSIFGKQHSRSGVGVLSAADDGLEREDLTVSGSVGFGGGAGSAGDVEWDVPVGQWTHIALALNKTGALLMVNGAVVLDVIHGMVTARCATPLARARAASPGEPLGCKAHEKCRRPEPSSRGGAARARPCARLAAAPLTPCPLRLRCLLLALRRRSGAAGPRQGAQGRALPPGRVR